jgi:aspartate aminotransferase-like enzyme
MFGPNTYFDDEVHINYSHRDKQFFDLFEKTRQLFSNTFHLEDYDILFIPGSGTVGIESLFYSLKKNVHMIGVEGTFKNRWNDLKKNYRKNNLTTESVNMFCLLETSCSTPFYSEDCLIDAISGFPYYDIPKGTPVFVTCLNKQIGSYVGLAVVCVRKDYWSNMIDEGTMSYLNLSRYRSYHSINQTPSTAPTFIFEHLYKVLREFDIEEFRNRINQVSKMVVDVVTPENIIGETQCPAITLKNNVVPESLARKYDIYGYWAGRPNYQIFTYSDRVQEYERFLNDLSKNIKL